MRAKYLLALLAVVMVHWVMHGRLVLFLRTTGTIVNLLILIIGVCVTAGPSQILKVIVLLPHDILMNGGSFD